MPRARATRHSSQSGGADAADSFGDWDGDDFGRMVGVTAVLETLIAIGLWWIYFDFVSIYRPRPGTAAISGWLYLHFDGENIAFFDDTERPVDDPGYPQENETNAFTRDMLFSHEVWEEVGEILIEAQDERSLLDIAERILSICSLDANMRSLSICSLDASYCRRSGAVGERQLFTLHLSGGI